MKEKCTEKLPTALEREAIKASQPDLFIVINLKVAKQDQERMDSQLVKLFSPPSFQPRSNNGLFLCTQKNYIYNLGGKTGIYLTLKENKKGLQKSVNFCTFWSRD